MNQPPIDNESSEQKGGDFRGEQESYRHCSRYASCKVTSSGPSVFSTQKSCILETLSFLGKSGNLVTLLLVHTF